LVSTACVLIGFIAVEKKLLEMEDMVKEFQTGNLVAKALERTTASIAAWASCYPSAY